MDIKTYKKHARKYNRIPVCHEILADTETPISLYKKLEPYSSHTFLFESVEGGEKWARYSFIGLEPARYIRAWGNFVEIHTPGTCDKFHTDSPLFELKKLMKNERPLKLDSLPRFWGGAVGYIGYDQVRFFEKIPGNAKNKFKNPDFYFIVCDTILVVDNIKKTLTIVCSPFIPDYRNAKTAWKTAQNRIKKIISLLKKHVPETPSKRNKTQHVKLRENINKKDFCGMVKKAKKYISSGEIIQVVLSQCFEASCPVEPFMIYRALRRLNPSPYMFYISYGDLKLIGSSPEVMVRLEGERVELRPIAGTARRGLSDEEDEEIIEKLLKDEKERAEHIMLVDLGRNDAGRISAPGSVHVTELMVPEKYSHVIHIVSHVEGKLRKNKDAYDVIQATFPAGTVSGAPKIRAMEIIDELEPHKRSIYAGSVGYIGFTGNTDTGIIIRTYVYHKGTLYLQVGAGIVADSDPAKEYVETLNKAEGLVRALRYAENGLEGQI